MSGLNPEGIVEVPSGSNNFAGLSPPAADFTVQFISENGDDVFYGDGVIAKELPNNEFKKLRSDVRVVSLAPTAASVTVSGRVLNVANQGIANAPASFTDIDGTIRTALTNSSGDYRFENVAAGGTFILEVRAKHYLFAPQVINVTDEITDLSFVGSKILRKFNR